MKEKLGGNSEVSLCIVYCPVTEKRRGTEETLSFDSTFGIVTFDKIFVFPVYSFCIMRKHENTNIWFSDAVSYLPYMEKIAKLKLKYIIR